MTISAGSFEGGSGPGVRLAIKEAFNIDDIVLAGLITESNGKVLSSGGMINIEPANGENIKIVKAIRISLPTPFIDSRMMLFKGTENDDGYLNWTDSVIMRPNPQLLTIDKGEQLFKQKCASCHAIAKSVTSPALAYISRLRPQKWLFDYTRNNPEIMHSGDPYANCLSKQYGKTPMPASPEMSSEDLNKLYTYIDNESYKSGLPKPDDHLKKCVDSCLIYRNVMDSLMAVRKSLIYNNGSGIAYKRTPPNGYVIRDTTVPSKLSPQKFPAVYYQFQITSFGWYNIARFFQEMEGVKDSRLIVNIEGQYRGHVSVFLIVPQPRVFQQGGPIENKADKYGFYNQKGELPLLQAVSASVIAVGEAQGHLVFDMVNFTTTMNQTLTLQPAQVSVQMMNEKISQLRFKNLDLSMKESKNTKAIGTIDHQLESMKPKTCDCNCGFKNPAIVSDSSFVEVQ